MPWYVWLCVGMAVLQLWKEVRYNVTHRATRDAREEAALAGAVASRAFWIALATFLLVLSRGV